MKVDAAFIFKGYPPEDPQRVREKLKNEGLSEQLIDEGVRIVCDSTSRDEWTRLLLQRWVERDVEFFELLTVILKHPGKLSLESIAHNYILAMRASHINPTARGFIRYLRAGPRAFEQAVKHPANCNREPPFKQTDEGYLVYKGSRKSNGVVDDNVVHEEEARRAFVRMSAYLNK